MRDYFLSRVSQGPYAEVNYRFHPLWLECELGIDRWVEGTCQIMLALI